ncbi:serine/threonine-protein kinase [Brevundimonas sp.]|uniref:serine/threonine-protein kinase n=1 Tax=Brevundimonas sp. TaxID=1871086 RepID=UPI00289EDB5F|nr:serine/threonine-protein kinase [Brevundimonas sp.]
MQKYTKQKELGRGGFGAVYEAVDENGEYVALKEFAPSAGMEEFEDQLRKRFRREAVYQKSIEHDNVVHIFEYNEGDEEEAPYIIMELADISLKDYIQKNPDLSVDNRISIIKDIISGVAAVHSMNHIHRDLKPENILGFKDEDSPTGYKFKISDFGLVSPAKQGETTLTMTGMAGGSTYYVSPEAMKNLNSCDSRSDIYSIGCIIYDLFVGKPRVPMAHLKVSGDIGAVIGRCTETNRSKRYGNVADLREEFIAAADLLEWNPQSDEGKRYLELLNKDELSEEEWDELDIALQDKHRDDDMREGVYPLFRAMKADHLQHLFGMDAGVFRSIANGLCDHVLASAGWFSFEYCDVLAAKLRRVFELGDDVLKANAMLAMLVLGVSHNRYEVERMFGRRMGPDQSKDVIKRFMTEADARDINLKKYLSDWEESLDRSRPDLHPLLVEIMT